MGEELPDRHLVSAGEAGDKLRDVIVEGELSLLLKEQNPRRGELLADGPDRVAHVGSRGSARLELRRAVRVRVRDSPVSDYGDRRARNSGRLQHLHRDGIDVRSERRVRRALCGRGDG